MTVYRKDIGILSDNDQSYFNLLSAVVESIDEFSYMVIMKNPRNFQIKIVPSDTTNLSKIIKEVNSLNNLFNLRISYSKSIKNSASVDFLLPL